MASAKFQKGSEEFMLFQDFWKLCQKHWIVEDSDQYWMELGKDANSFVEKYGNLRFAEVMALAFMNAKEEEGLKLNKK